MPERNNRLRAMGEIFCREPYRIFFPLGVLMGTIGLTPWLFYALGWSETYSGFFHSSTQSLVYMSCFIVGFLTTFIPRFTATAYAGAVEILFFLFLLTGAVLFLYAGQWVIAEVCYLGVLLGLTVFITRRILQRRKSEGPAAGLPPVAEMIWIPAGVLHGTVGTFLLLLGQLKILPVFAISVGKPMMHQGFLFAVAMGIGGFLIPRIMRGSRPASSGNSQKASSPQSKRVRISPVAVHLGCMVGLFFSFWLEGWGHVSLGYGLRALVVTAVFRMTRILPRIDKSSDLYVWLAWISAWMVAAGLWMAAVFPVYRVAVLHVSFIGGFSLMTFSVGSMVIMSHSGAGQRLQGHLWILWVVAAGIAMAVIKRLAVIAYPNSYFQFLGWASGMWMAAAWAWLCFMIPYLLRIPSADEFGRMHEQAKERLKGSAS